MDRAPVGAELPDDGGPARPTAEDLRLVRAALGANYVSLRGRAEALKELLPELAPIPDEAVALTLRYFLSDRYGRGDTVVPGTGLDVRINPSARNCLGDVLSRLPAYQGTGYVVTNLSPEQTALFRRAGPVAGAGRFHVANTQLPASRNYGANATIAIRTHTARNVAAILEFLGRTGGDLVFDPLQRFYLVDAIPVGGHWFVTLEEPNLQLSVRQLGAMLVEMRSRLEYLDVLCDQPEVAARLTAAIGAAYTLLEEVDRIRAGLAYLASEAPGASSRALALAIDDVTHVLRPLGNLDLAGDDSTDVGYLRDITVDLDRYADLLSAAGGGLQVTRLPPAHRAGAQIGKEMARRCAVEAGVDSAAMTSAVHSQSGWTDRLRVAWQRVRPGTNRDGR